MKYFIIFALFAFCSCEQKSINFVKDVNNNQIEKTINTDLSNARESQIYSDTIKISEKALKTWTFNKEIISLFQSEESDDFYYFGQIKTANIQSGKFIRIPKSDSPYTGFEKMVLQFPYLTIEQSYREGDYTNYEYITFKTDADSIYLYKYAVDYTNIYNLEEEIPGLRLDQQNFGKVKIENVDLDFLSSLRSSRSQ